MSDIKHHRVTYVSALLVVGFLLLFALNPEAFSALVDTSLRLECHPLWFVLAGIHAGKIL